MKLIIDIPKEDYNHAKQQVEDGIMNPLKIFIASGTPIPDNATNGEVIKAMFPDAEIHLDGNGVFDGNTCADCSKIEQIRKEISEWKDDKVIHAERNEMVDIALEIIDKYTK